MLRRQARGGHNEQKSLETKMAMKRALENKIHLLDVSYVSTYIFTEVTVRNRTNKIQIENM